MRGAVFDFDGVIANSMALHARAYREALAPLGIQVRDEEVYQLEGGRSESVLRYFLDKGKQSADSAALQRLQHQKQEIFRRLDQPRIYEGAEDLVRKVRARAAKMGLVTGTRRENLERLMPQLLPLFDTVLAQDAYARDKPDPEPYAKTAKEMGLPPKDCVAMENAPFGVRSAVAAGYGHVVAITTTVSRAQLLECGAHVVVDDHAQATRAMLKALGDGQP